MSWKVGKNRLSIGQYIPLYGEGLIEKSVDEGGKLEGADGGEDIDWSEYTDEPTHRHFGHTDDHPVRLRHRKISADPVHADEDKLVDQYKELASKAKMGGCTPDEIKLLRHVKGQMMELNSKRVKDARQIMLGKEMMGSGGPQQGSSVGAVSSYSGVQHHQQRPLDHVHEQRVG